MALKRLRTKLKTLRHCIIPDTQIKPNVPTDHLDWIAEYLCEKQPDVINVMGDWWDFPSLNRHNEKGSLPLEGTRFQDDVDAGNLAFHRFNRKLLSKLPTWKPKKNFIKGNHEERADTAALNDPKWLGTIGSNHCNVEDFKWHQFLERVELNGVTYSHFFQASHSDRPIGGNIENRIAKVGSSFVQGHEQGLMIGNKIMANGRTYYGLVAGSCLTPDHKVLTSDLIYIPLGDVKVGQTLVSFDEHPKADGKRSRRYRTGTVEAVCRDFADCFEVTLGNDKQFKVTGDHLWLTRRMGTTTGWLRTNQIVTDNGNTHVPILLDEWDTGRTYKHGWLSGIYDGEGCLYERQTTGGHVVQLTLSQKEGLVLERARELLADLIGIDSFTHRYDRAASCLYVKGGRTQIAKVLGILRPLRLLPKWKPESLGRVCIDRWVPIVSVKPIGRKEIVRIAIDAKTMVIEGYGHHNCYLHRENYRGNQGQRHWRGIVMLNDVENGEYDIMPISLRYLCKHYENMRLVDYMTKRYPKQDWSHLA